MGKFWSASRELLAPELFAQPRICSSCSRMSKGFSVPHNARIDAYGYTKTLLNFLEHIDTSTLMCLKIRIVVIGLQNIRLRSWLSQLSFRSLANCFQAKPRHISNLISIELIGSQQYQDHPKNSGVAQQTDL